MILDIGGGGEGVIGRLYGENVIAIDNSQEELDEAPDVCRKLLMDATDMAFDDCAFDHVTAFYSLMFMDAQEQKMAILEAARVLKYGGDLHIWDCNITSAYPEPYCVDVEIQLPEEQISTTYGVGKLGKQGRDSIVQMCMDAGLHQISVNATEAGFYLLFRKPLHHTEK